MDFFFFFFFLSGNSSELGKWFSGMKNITEILISLMKELKIYVPDTSTALPFCKNPCEQK